MTNYLTRRGLLGGAAVTGLSLAFTGDPRAIAGTRPGLGYGDLVPDPALFVRFSPDATIFVTDATIEVIERGVTLAEASLGEGRGAAIVGPADQIDLPSRAAAWRPALEIAFSRPAKRAKESLTS